MFIISLLKKKYILKRVWRSQINFTYDQRSIYSSKKLNEFLYLIMCLTVIKTVFILNSIGIIKDIENNTYFNFLLILKSL